MRLQAYLGLLAGCLLFQSGVLHARDGVEKSGDVLRIALPAAAIALTVRRDDRDGRRDFYRAFGTNVIATAGLKAAVDKNRPDGSGDDAFPSGHVSTAFQAAAFIHRRYGFNDAWIAYLLATYVGWTRVDADKHDEADVLAGAAVGIASSFLLTDRLEGRAVSLATVVNADVIGVRVHGRF